jgi:shikimate kinase/3-dehydroquinate synthase
VTAPDDRAIAFVGFMGAGKSAAARVVAEALGTDARDSDLAIEEEDGRPIADIFAVEGEAGFREHEERVVRELLAGGGVVSLGGGAVETASVREALAGHVVVWCDVEREVAWERVSRNDRRPLGRDRAEFDRRFEARRPLYEEVATVTLPSESREAARGAAPWLADLRGHPGLRMAWARSRSGQYPAVVGEGATRLLSSASDPRLPGRWFALADAAALAAHTNLVPPSEATYELAGGEESKTLAEADRVLQLLADAGARRDDGVIAFGGGVVGDLAGFCAATYQRGIPVVQVPTTLVAQVDSAYGGKTGVDLPQGKNYVGAYHQPLAVLADPATLATLPPEEVAAGFAEVVKTALIAGGSLWERVRALPAGELPDDEIIFACARTKLAVVAEDERDSGRRAVLNLGHTVGHAIEAASGYSRYRHGEAVGLGLLASLRLSGAGDLRAEVGALLARHGLPTTLDPAIDPDAILAAVGRDKKATADGVGFVLAETPGEVRVGERVDEATVRAAIAELRENPAA